MKKTNAVRLLQQKHIEFELLSYTYKTEDLSVQQIAEDNQLAVEQIYKTLVAKGVKSGVMVAVIPGDQSLNLKKLAQASGNKKVTLIPVKMIQSVTGYIRGGCSPLGMKKEFPVFIAEQAFDFEKVYVNAGSRGLLMLLTPQALKEACKGTKANLTA